MPRAARPTSGCSARRSVRPRWRLLTVAVLTVLLTACGSSIPSITVPPTRPPGASTPTAAAAPPTSSPAPVAAAPTSAPTARPVVTSAASPAPRSNVVVVPFQPSPTGDVAAAAPSPPPAAALIGPIKIVSSLPRTRADQTQNDTIVTAIKMALDEAGNKVDGASIVFEDLDDAAPERGTWSADKEAENANKAVADPDVMVYIGPFNSGAARVSIPILNRADLVMISPSATYAGLTRSGTGETNEPEAYYPSGSRNFARVVPTDDVQGTVGAGWAKQLGASRVYVLHDTELYGKTVVSAFVEAAGRIGLRLIGGPDSVDPRARDLTGIAAKVRDAGPDLVYYGGLTDNNAGLLFKELRAALGPDVKLMGPDGLYQQGFIDEAGDGAEGVYITFGGLAPSKQSGKGAEWYRNYRVRYTAEPEVYAAYSYEATKVALDAIKRAGRKDRAAIRAAVLATREYEGILGRWSFDANGDTTLTTISGRQVKDGKFDDANAVTLQAP